MKKTILCVVSGLLASFTYIGELSANVDCFNYGNSAVSLNHYKEWSETNRC